MKVWRVKEVQPDGAAVFEHSVEWIDMRQKLSGSSEVAYDSRKDKEAPPGFQDVASAVGVPLSTITLDPLGKVVKREKNKVKGSSSQESGEIAMPLPSEAIEVGHVWTQPCDIDIPIPTGGVKKIKAVQRFKLESVKTGVASIGITTQLLTPVTDPAIEAQVVQRQGEGKVRFDIDAGRVLSQNRDTDKHVIGFRGEASSLHYVNRFSEEFVPEPTVVAVEKTSERKK
jgi:hypothetical protein